MRQLTYVEAGVVQWREVPDPVLTDPAGALVAPLAVARCDLDLPMAAQGLFPGPFAVGHETVGEVVEVGPEVTRFRVGDRVLVSYQVSCGACPACADHRYGGCRKYRGQVGAAFGFGPAGGGHGGGLSDLLPVPAADHLLIPAPDGVAPEALCTLPDNGVDGYRTVVNQAANAPRSDVLVVGGAASSVGLYAVAAAVALGFRRVRYVDHDQAQCEAAARLGADAQLHQGPWPRSFERAAVTVENTMETDGLACTLRSTDDYGYCTSVAIHFAETTPLPLLHMYTKGITLHLSRADSRRYLPEVIDLVTAGRLDPAMVPTRVVSWDDAADEWLQPAVKLVVARRPSAIYLPETSSPDRRPRIPGLAGPVGRAYLADHDRRPHHSARLFKRRPGHLAGVPVRHRDAALRGAVPQPVHQAPGRPGGDVGGWLFLFSRRRRGILAEIEADLHACVEIHEQRT